MYFWKFSSNNYSKLDRSYLKDSWVTHVSAAACFSQSLLPNHHYRTWKDHAFCSSFIDIINLNNIWWNHIAYSYSRIIWDIIFYFVIGIESFFFQFSGLYRNLKLLKMVSSFYDNLIWFRLLAKQFLLFRLMKKA